MFDLIYLTQLIAGQVEENPELEYKAAPALLREDPKTMEITKDVSSFANSNGGILIYGLAEDPSNRRMPGKIDPVDCKKYSNEWLEQIINSKIRPRIHGLKIHVIDIPECKDQVVYVLEIPKGDTAHQAEDRRYYRRHNFTTEMLLDHEIRDIMGRQKNPQIRIDFEIAKQANLKSGTTNNPVLNEQQPYFYWLNIYAENAGRIYAKYVNVLLTLPQICIKGYTYDRRYDTTEQIKADNKVRDLVEPNAERFYQGAIAKPKQYGPARHEPILPGMRVLLKSIQLNEYATDAGNEINWTVYADNAEPKSGKMEFHEMSRW
jgi:Putative DNA-binding domain